MIYFLIVLNTLFLSVYIYKKYCVELKILDTLILIGMCLFIANTYITVMYFIFNYSNVIIWLVLITIVFLFTARVLIKTGLVDYGPNNDVIEEAIYDSMIISVSIVGTFISVIVLFKELYFLYQLLLVIGLNIAFFFIRQFTKWIVYPEFIYIFLGTLVLFTIGYDLEYRRDELDFSLMNEVISTEFTYQSIGNLELDQGNLIGGIYETDEGIHFAHSTTTGKAVSFIPKDSTTVETLFTVTGFEDNDSYLRLEYYDDDLFIIAKSGLYIYQNGSYVELYTHENTETRSFPQDYFGALYFDEGNLIFETDKGTYLYQNGTLVPSDLTPKTLSGYSMISYEFDIFYIENSGSDTSFLGYYDQNYTYIEDRWYGNINSIFADRDYRVQTRYYDGEEIIFPRGEKFKFETNNGFYLSTYTFMDGSTYYNFSEKIPKFFLDDDFLSEPLFLVNTHGVNFDVSKVTLKQPTFSYYAFYHLNGYIAVTLLIACLPINRQKNVKEIFKSKEKLTVQEVSEYIQSDNSSIK